MRPILTECTTSVSGRIFDDIESSTIIGKMRLLRIVLENKSMEILARHWQIDLLGEHQLTQSEREFQEQKEAFEQIPPLLLEQYRGHFVASSNGRIVDSDEDFIALTHRFFENFGDVPVFITKIGRDDGISIETPFFD